MHLVPSRVAVGLALLSASLSACGDEGPRLPAAVRVTQGDGQIAPVGSLLPVPIAITVVNADGSPAQGLRVDWRTDGDGSLVNPDQATNVDGQARARWQLGASEGERRAQAVLPGLAPAVFTAIAEGPDAVPYDEIRPLDFDTYDGSHQVVHPDFVATPNGLFGRPYHLAITPTRTATPPTRIRRSSSPPGARPGRSPTARPIRSSCRARGTCPIPTSCRCRRAVSCGSTTGR